MSHSLWVEKYRPNNFDGLILDPLNRKILMNILEKNFVPFGTPVSVMGFNIFYYGAVYIPTSSYKSIWSGLSFALRALI